jgi:DNA-binding transcriptional ArsR family regulator
MTNVTSFVIRCYQSSVFSNNYHLEAVMQDVQVVRVTGWTFLTNHAQVMLCIARNSRIAAREIAAEIGITERAVQRILNDLEQGGYLSRARDGRKNVYEIHAERPMRHPAQDGRTVRDLLELVGEPVF